MTRVFLMAAGLIFIAGGAIAGPPTVSDAPACQSNYPAGAASHVCACTGEETGSVWGAGPYTADSALCAAARHAGAVGASGGLISAYAVDGQDSYPASTQNGVTTSSWGSYGASFDFSWDHAATGQSCGSYPVGQPSYSCACSGLETGSVWGSGPYTADSTLCVAARHAGVIGSRGGSVRVLGLDGLSGYTGSTVNGVTTANWGQYGASVMFNRN